MSVAGVAVGGLTSEPARARIEAAFARSVRVTYRHRNVWITPESLGAGLSVDAAVTSALAATPRSRIALPVRYSQARVDAQVSAARAALRPRAGGRDGDRRAPAPARSSRPRRSGVAVDTDAMRTALAAVLRDGTRAPVRLVTHAVAPKHAIKGFGPVIVITRGANTLRLYDGSTAAFARSRSQPARRSTPRPSGLWRIVDKQRDPWWYPPTQDAWAQGLKPVPPGPSNPLGTRWMGLDAPGVGIHGTDAPSSIGYSASHGCIRMQVPDAEWLFEHVQVGTPVVIL